MSLPLKYEAICGTCNRRIPAGTEASLVRHPDGHSVAFHLECPSDASAPVAPKKRRTEDNFDIRYCTGACVWANGVAFRRGEAPAGCPLCGAHLLDEARHLEAAA